MNKENSDKDAYIKNKAVYIIKYFEEYFGRESSSTILDDEYASFTIEVEPFQMYDLIKDMSDDTLELLNIFIYEISGFKTFDSDGNKVIYSTMVLYLKSSFNSAE